MISVPNFLEFFILFNIFSNISKSKIDIRAKLTGKDSRIYCNKNVLGITNICVKKIFCILTDF